MEACLIKLEANLETDRPLKRKNENLMHKSKRNRDEQSFVNQRNESEMKDDVQTHFQAVGSITVEMAMKKSEIMRWKEKVLSELKSMGTNDVNKETQHHLKLSQLLLPIESELLQMQNQLQYHMKQIEILKLEMDNLQKRKNEKEDNPPETKNSDSVQMEDFVDNAKKNISSTNGGIADSSWRNFLDVITLSPTDQSKSIQRASKFEPRCPVWHNESEYNSCEICSHSFGIFNWKHHCRKCGRVVCSECSPKEFPIPQFGITESVRVCKDCESVVLEYNVIVQRQSNLNSSLMGDDNSNNPVFGNNIGFGGHISSPSINNSNSKSKSRRLIM